jgi:hypothetical protein
MDWSCCKLVVEPVLLVLHAEQEINCSTAAVRHLASR